MARPIDILRMSSSLTPFVSFTQDYALITGQIEVPAGATFADVYIEGKGGNGRFSGSTATGGGGGGGAASETLGIPVVGLEQLMITVSSTLVALQRGATPLVSARNGSNATSATGGAGGPASGGLGDSKWSGTAGSNGQSASSTQPRGGGSGGQGGGRFGGNGGQGASDFDGAATDGSNYGGGGGGSGNAVLGFGNAFGAPGLIRITWR